MTFAFTEDDFARIGDYFHGMVPGRLKGGLIHSESGNIAWIFGIKSSNPNGNGEFSYTFHTIGPDSGDKVRNAYRKGRMVARTGMPSGLVVNSFPELLQDEDFPAAGGVMIGKDLISSVDGCWSVENESLATHLGTYANMLRQTTARVAIRTAQAGKGRDRFVRGQGFEPSPVAAVSVRNTPAGLIAVTGSPQPSERVRREAEVS